MREILIYGYIGDCDEDENCVNAQQIIDQINWTEDSEIKVRINSPGGSVFQGFAIFDALNKCGKRVITQVDGLAASMASIILMAGEEIIVSPFAQIMTHKPCGSASGSAIEIRQQADLLDELEKTMLSIYVARTGLSEAECQAKFLSDTDTWFNAQQAVDAKLADRIEEGRMKVLPVITPTDPTSVYKHFAAKLDTNMNLIEKLKTDWNLSAEMSDDSIYAHLTSLQAKAAQSDLLSGEVITLKEQVQAYEAAEAVARDNELISLVDAAIAERRILASSKDSWIAMLKASPEAAKTSLSAIAAVPDLSLVPGGVGAKKEREDWTFATWSRKDPNGLEVMKSEKHADYVALFKAEYGVDPK